MAKKPAQPAPEIDPETSTEIATFAPALPMVVFQSPEELESLLGKIRNLVATFTPDLSTVKGRAEIKHLAATVTRTKTALDNAGKELNAGKRAEIDAVDAERRRIWAELESLAKKAREPLDKWEAAEALRVAAIKSALADIENSAFLLDDETTSATIAARIAQIEAMEFDADQFQDWLAIAVAAKTKALSILKQAQMRAMRSEEPAAELERLREADRLRIAEQAEVTAYANARAEAEAESERRDEAERMRVAQAEADERDRQYAETERIAEAASIAVAHAAQEAQTAIDAAEAEAEALRAAETARLAALETARLEQAARDADRAHRGKIMKATKEAIIAAMVGAGEGATDDAEARAIVLAIVANEIPNVKLTF